MADDKIPMTTEEMLRSAVALLRVMMTCTDSSKIRPLDWWTRARSALQVAADSSDNFGSMVSTMGRKLQVDVVAGKAAEEIARLAAEVRDDFEAWRRFCAAESLYVAAIASAESKQRRAEWQAAQKEEDQ